MRKQWRRAGAVIAIIATCVLGIASSAHAATITQPTPSGIPPAYAVPGDVNGNPQSFTVVATGFAPSTLIYLEVCDGLSPSTPGWDAASDCDNGASNAPVLSDGTGMATFTAGTNRQFVPVKGLQPTGLFACDSPDDAPTSPVPALGDWTDCQLKVSSSNTAATSDQTFLTLTYPAAPGDHIPPTINSFTPAEGSLVHGVSVPFSGDATDAGSGVASMTFTIDDGSVIAPIVESTAPYEGTFDSTSLADGDHTINVTATDNSDNTSAVETQHFTVDNTAPTITSFTPAEGAYVRGAAAAVSGTATDAVSGVASMSFTIDDGSVITPIVDDSAPFASTFDSTLLTAGLHTIYVTATDAAGNPTMTETHNFTVDNTAPLQPHFTNVLAAFTSAPTVAVSFADTDATSGIKSYQVQVEKANYNAVGFGAWAVAPGASALSTTSYTLTGLALGYDYCLRVIATDKAGNVSIPSKVSCTSRLIDDHAAVHSLGWVQGRSTAYYAGTYSTTRSANRTLSLAGFRGIRLAIRAIVCPSCGAIRVYVGTTLLRTVSLVSAVNKNTVILLPVFSSRAGTIKIVTTSTRVVTIDGIGASRT
jgi:hypothetical protein